MLRKPPFFVCVISPLQRTRSPSRPSRTSRPSRPRVTILPTATGMRGHGASSRSRETLWLPGDPAGADWGWEGLVWVRRRWLHLPDQVLEEWRGEGAGLISVGVINKQDKGGCEWLKLVEEVVVGYWNWLLLDYIYAARAKNDLWPLTIRRINVGWN